MRLLASRIGTISTLIQDLTLPILSMFTGAGMNRAVRDALGGEECIEDLWLPYFCMSTNLTTMDEEVRARLRQVVDASRSIGTVCCGRPCERL